MADEDITTEQEIETETTEETSEETETETTEETEQESDKDELDLDGAKAALAKVRKSEAAMRVRLREAETKLKDAKTPEEVEAVKAEIAAGNAAEAHALLVENVALRHKLPDDLAATLTGATREELEAHATVLAKYVPSDEGDGDPDLSGGLKPSSGGDSNDTFDAEAEARKLRRSRR